MAQTLTHDATSPLQVREAVGVFHNAMAFEAAIDHLERSGFDRADISVLASEHAITEKLGHRYERASELEDDAAVPRATFVERESLVEGQSLIIGGLAYVGALAAIGAVVSSGGTALTAFLAAGLVGGSGGLLGTAFATRLGQKRADHITDQLVHGGLLLWVRLRDEEHEARALKILREHAGDDVHAHNIAVADTEPNPVSGLNIDPFLPNARI